MRSTNVALAVLFARLVLGLIFLMAGVHKVFVMGPAEHVKKFFLPFTDTFLPTWSLWAVGATIPFVELLGGALVFVGLWRRGALVALGCVLVIVTFGHLLHVPLFATYEHIFPRLCLLLFVLMVPAEHDRFALDALRRGPMAVAP
jgi:putative oxidoreductase